MNTVPVRLSTKTKRAFVGDASVWLMKDSPQTILQSVCGMRTCCLDASDHLWNHHVAGQ